MSDGGTAPRYRRAALALSLAAFAAAACGGRMPGASMAPPTCEPVAGELAAGVRSDALAGTYELTLVATSGPRSGEAVSGSLRLRPYGTRPAPLAAPGVRYPLFGEADVDLTSVGAVAPGALGSDDPQAPGVLVLEWPRAGAPAGTNEVVLRLGAEGNREERLRFDGTSMALFVDRVDEDRFAGRWRSGAGEELAAGHFCARRRA